MATIDVHRTEQVGADVDTIWRILGEEFLTVSTWASAVTSSGANPNAPQGPSGAPNGGRSCTVQGFGTTDERIVHFDPVRHELAYSVAAKKIPSFVHGMRNSWSVTADGQGRARVTTRITGEARGAMGALMAPLMRIKLRATQRGILADLRVFAETGTPSKAKRRSIAKSAQVLTSEQ